MYIDKLKIDSRFNHETENDVLSKICGISKGRLESPILGLDLTQNYSIIEQNISFVLRNT